MLPLSSVTAEFDHLKPFSESNAIQKATGNLHRLYRHVSSCHDGTAVLYRMIGRGRSTLIFAWYAVGTAVQCLSPLAARPTKATFTSLDKCAHRLLISHFGSSPPTSSSSNQTWASTSIPMAQKRKRSETMATGINEATALVSCVHDEVLVHE